MTISYFAPLPPARTGVADYAASLLRALEKRTTVLVNSQGGLPIYHIGNNGLHAGIYREALARPGVAILHDAVLHHLLLGQLDENSYREEFAYNYGEWTRDSATRLWRDRAGSSGDERFFRYPMLRRIVESSRLVLVHNAAAARMVRAHGDATPVELIPHLYDPAGESVASPSMSRDTRFAILGYLRETKRVHVALQAIRAVPKARLCLSGEFVSKGYERALHSKMAAPNVIRAGHCANEEFPRRIADSDVVLSLRYPAAGETSGITVRAMGAGRPVVVTDGEENADLPDGTCVKIPAGAPERASLEIVMAWLAGSRADREAMGAAARRHILAHHRVDRVADRIMTLLKTVALIALALLPAHALVKRDVKSAMRDGVKLAASVYLPASNGKFPALLVRTPYGRGSELSENYRFLVDRGYAFVMQDVRGRYASEGHFHPLQQEIPDGADTLDWIARQPWCNGRIGMLGGSYSGLVQWKAALSNHPALKAIFPVHAGIDEYRDRFYSRGGAFRLGHRMLWLAENLKAHGFTPPPFESFVKHRPLRSLDKAATGHRLDLLQQALDHPGYDEFWQSIGVSERLSKVRVPAYSVAGWFDPNVQSDLETVTTLRSQGKEASIVVGAWGHNMSIPLMGVDLGPDSRFAVRNSQVEWFDAWLKDVPRNPDRKPIRIFVMGRNQWREESEWPIRRAVATKFYLASPGKLQAAVPADAVDRFAYDPRNPVPTRGGAACCNPAIFPWGPMDQRPVESRPDVLVYSTDLLTEAVEVTGVIKAQLAVSTSVPDTDFTVKLVDVLPNGEARSLTDGILRLRYRDSNGKAVLAKPGETYSISIDGGVTSNVFLPGHRIRVEISSSNFPKYDRNPNTGRPVADDADAVVAQQTIYLGRRAPSHILLPVVPSK